MMAAGELRDRIRIVGLTKSQNGFGEAVPQDAPSDYVSARVRQMGNAEMIRNGLTDATSSYAVRIRYRTDVTDEMKVSFRGVMLDIFSMVEGGAREWLDIVAITQGRAK